MERDTLEGANYTLEEHVIIILGISTYSDFFFLKISLAIYLNLVGRKEYIVNQLTECKSTELIWQLSAFVKYRTSNEGLVYFYLYF